MIQPKWEDISISLEHLSSIEKNVKLHHNYNSACILKSCWTEKMNRMVLDNITRDGFLGYGYVGSGWPHKSDQSWALKNDIHNYAECFRDVDNRDTGDAVYQANRLHPFISDKKRPMIVDFGAGYGRLAVPFIHKFGYNVSYIGIDYVPISLCVAPQFVEQHCSVNVARYKSKFTFQEPYTSMPAWRVEEIPDNSVDMFISIHSFQEMEDETIDFYVDLVEKKAKHKSYFYSVNLSSTKNFAKKQWTKMFKNAFPINRDGSYNEVLWRIK